MDKGTLRREIGAKKRAMSASEIEAASCRLAAMLFQSRLYAGAEALYGYLSFNQEVRTEAILLRALRDGKRVAVPKVYGDEMRFIWIDDLSRVAPGAFGILEPIDDAPIADDPAALVLMPGLAFDAEGHRVGYGGGFYDRYLAKEPDHPRVALCYGFQFFDRLETEAHDIPVDVVIADQ